MTLYEIENAILNCVDLETGEILDVDKLEALGLQRDEKINNIACWIKNLTSDIEQLKKERDGFAERIKSKERKKESLKNYLSGFLAGEKFESEKCKVSFRKTTSIVVDDFEKLDADFIRVKQEADKTKIAEAIKLGITVDGAHVENNMSMTVK